MEHRISELSMEENSSKKSLPVSLLSMITAQNIAPNHSSKFKLYYFIDNLQWKDLIILYQPIHPSRWWSSPSLAYSLHTSCTSATKVRTIGHRTSYQSSLSSYSQCCKEFTTNSTTPTMEWVRMMWIQTYSKSGLFKRWNSRMVVKVVKAIFCSMGMLWLCRKQIKMRRICLRVERLRRAILCDSASWLHKMKKTKFIHNSHEICDGNLANH